MPARHIEIRRLKRKGAMHPRKWPSGRRFLTTPSMLNALEERSREVLRKSIALVIGAGACALALSFAANQLHGATVSSAARPPGPLASHATASLASVVTRDQGRANFSAARVTAGRVTPSRAGSSIAPARTQRSSFAFADRSNASAGRHGAYGSMAGGCHHTAHNARVTGGS
jgi:hypothetical protein